MQCDMCGRDSELFVTLVEGTELNVCKGCARHGKVLRTHRKNTIAQQDAKTFVPLKPQKETIQLIVDDYPAKIKAKRESLGLKQEELALKLALKESLIHKMESGHFEPSIAIARKLERFLHIKLVEEHEEGQSNTGIMPRKDNAFTIGDFIKVRK